MWRYKTRANCLGRHLLQADKTTVKRWLIKTYVSGCGWDVLNTWSVWKNVDSLCVLERQQLALFEIFVVVVVLVLSCFGFKIKLELNQNRVRNKPMAFVSWCEWFTYVRRCCSDMFHTLGHANFFRSFRSSLDIFQFPGFSVVRPTKLMVMSFRAAVFPSPSLMCLLELVCVCMCVYVWSLNASLARNTHNLNISSRYPAMDREAKTRCSLLVNGTSRFHQPRPSCTQLKWKSSRPSSYGARPDFLTSGSHAWIKPTPAKPLRKARYDHFTLLPARSCSNEERRCLN